jgi:hypothetical protein
MQYDFFPDPTKNRHVNVARFCLFPPKVALRYHVITASWLFQVTKAAQET